MCGKYRFWFSFILGSILVFSACHPQYIEQPASVPGARPEIGRVHNAVLQEILRRRSLVPQDRDGFDVNRFVDDLVASGNKVLVQEGYPPTITRDFVIAKIMEANNALGVYEMDSTFRVRDQKAIHNSILEAGVFTPGEREWYDGFIDGIDRTTNKDLHGYLQSYAEKHGYPDPNGTLGTAVDVFMHSHDFWQENAPGADKKDIGDEIGIQEMDLMGALTGGILTGGFWVGVAIGAAYYSTMAIMAEADCMLYDINGNVVG